MAKRVPASERTSERIEELLAAGVGGGKAVGSELIRLGVRNIVEEALEAEVEEQLGRGYYGREGEGEGYRKRERGPKTANRTNRGVKQPKRVG